MWCNPRKQKTNGPLPVDDNAKSAQMGGRYNFRQKKTIDKKQKDIDCSTKTVKWSFLVIVE